MQVFTIIADIIKSRGIENRSEFQKSLETKLSSVSTGASTIVSPYTITLGDEFQGVYDSCGEILDHLFQIMLFIHPVKLRVAVGVGDLDTSINRQSALGMDGPAFHSARKGIEELKACDTNSIRFCDPPGDTDLELINSGLSLVLSEMDGWKINTHKTFEALRHGRPVNDIFPELGISQRGVYKLIATNHLEQYLAFFISLNSKLSGRYS